MLCERSITCHILIILSSLDVILLQNNERDRIMLHKDTQKKSLCFDISVKNVVKQIEEIYLGSTTGAQGPRAPRPVPTHSDLPRRGGAAPWADCAAAASSAAAAGSGGLRATVRRRKAARRQGGGNTNRCSSLPPSFLLLPLSLNPSCSHSLTHTFSLANVPAMILAQAGSLFLPPYPHPSCHSLAHTHTHTGK